MKRILMLACCVVLFSHLPAFAQNYSGQWYVEAHITYATANHGLTHGDYRGLVTVSQSVFSPPMPISGAGNLQLYFSDDSGYPPVFPLTFNFTMTDPNTIPPQTMLLPPPYDMLTLTVSGSVSGNTGSGLIASSIVGDGPGPISGTWNAKKYIPIPAPTLTDWGMGLMSILLVMSGIYLVRKKRTV
jgi:hypothetical protein